MRAGLTVHNHTSSPLELTANSASESGTTSGSANSPLTVASRATAHLPLDTLSDSPPRWWKSRRGPVLVAVRVLAAIDGLDKDDVAATTASLDEAETFCLRRWWDMKGRTRVAKLSRVEGAATAQAGRRAASSSSWLVYQWRDNHGAHLSVYASRPLVSWTSSIPPETPLSSLYLPGTHESLALHGFPISSCQTFPLAMQLNAGLRFLDLRYALKHGTLIAYHGIQSQYMSAADALGEVYGWLDGKGKGETVIVSIKQENSAHGFEDAMWLLLEQRLDLWYLENRWPTLGEVRSKCVLFCRYGFHGKRGIHPQRWDNNSPVPWTSDIGGQPVVVQDWYSIGSFVKIPEKAALVLSLLNRRASATLDSSRLRINFCSGATLLTAFPFVVAKGFGIPRFLGVKGVNHRVLEHLVRSGREDAGDAGMILLLDYWEVPEGLVEIFVAWNFS